MGVLKFSLSARDLHWRATRELESFSLSKKAMKHPPKRKIGKKKSFRVERLEGEKKQGEEEEEEGERI